MTTHLRSGEALAMTHDALESYLVEEGRELQRRLLQAHLDVRAAAEQRVTVADGDGVKRTKARSDMPRTLRSVVGAVVVTRILYQGAGMECLAPQDASLNLPPESYSLGVRRCASEEAACGSFDHVVDRLQRTTGAAVAKRQVEELVCRAAEDFEAFYLEREPEPEDTTLYLVLTFDGAGVPMRPEALREVTRRASERDEQDPRWPHKRLPPGKKRTRKRMGMVAAVYGVEPHRREPADIVRQLRPVQSVTARQKRPHPVNKRVWASVTESGSEVIEQAFAEALLRDPEQKRRWLVLVDGDKKQLRAVRKTARELGVEVTIILDVIHVLEYLWEAAYGFHPPGSKEAEREAADDAPRRRRRQHRRRRHDAQRDQAGSRQAQGRRQVRQLPTQQPQPPRLCHRSPRGLPHRDRRGRGSLPLPRASAARHRRGPAGSRLAGAEAVLRLRALKASGDFDAYWRFHTAAEYRVHHASRYADGMPPNPIPQPRLSLVK